MRGKSNVLTARMLCPECRELRAVRTEGDVLTLDCGHSRPELLPKSSMGVISLEDLDSSLGRQLFPNVINVSPAFEDRRYK